MTFTGNPDPIRQSTLSLSTTGTSGPATFDSTSGVLNIPNYATGGAPGFSGISSGTNTTAAMVVGTGSSISASGSGTITATTVAVGGISGLGTSIATALAVNVGTAGSPVINGGVLGTPSSGTLTNATGLPIIAGTSGTLTEARGGTNQTTYSTGDMLYATGANTLGKRAIGSTNDVLTVIGGVPTWQAPAGGSSAFSSLTSGTNTTAAMVVGTGASLSVSGSGTITATTATGNAGSATILATGRTLAITGDLTWTSPSFNGSTNVTAAGTLATVNSNVGLFGSATASPTYTVNGKGLITAAADVTITPAVGSITGLGTGVSAALAINTGSAGAVVLFNGALGTPSSGVATNLTGTAAGLTAGTVTTNANLTGDVTSTGNATAIASGVIVNDDVNASAGILLSKTNIYLTTTGTSGASTLNTTTGVLNIPQYTGGGGGGLSRGQINQLAICATL